MKIEDFLALIKAGYSKAEIDAMLSADKPAEEVKAPEEVPEEMPAEEPAAEPTQPDALEALIKEVQDLKKAVQSANVRNDSFEQKSSQERASDILASLINPTIGGK